MPQFAVTGAQIRKLNSGLTNADALADAINATADRYSISTQRRIRYFVAQSFFETASYTAWSENLYYSSPERIAVVWSTRFTTNPQLVGTFARDKSGRPYPQALALASDYIKNPKKLGDKVYGGRNGNAADQGFDFRGRGGFHLTFLNNYDLYSQEVYGDNRCVTNPDLVSQPQDAMMSAGSFWNRNGLNALADSDSFTECTKVINGSTRSVPERLPILNKVNAALVW